MSKRKYSKRQPKSQQNLGKQTPISKKEQKYIPLLVFLFAFILYSNTLNHLYAIDDNIAIYTNKLVLSGFKELPDLLTKPFYYGSAGEAGDNQIYRPLTSLSFATDIALFGEQPFGFHHFMNIFLYAISAIFLFLLMKRLLRQHHKRTMLC